MNMSFLQELFSTITQRDALRRKRSEALAPVSHAEPVSYTHLTLPTICSV